MDFILLSNVSSILNLEKIYINYVENCTYYDYTKLLACESTCKLNEIARLKYMMLQKKCTLYQYQLNI